MKYKGIKKPPGGDNIGLVWEKKDDGNYHCTSHPGFPILAQWQIDSDLVKGYLKLIEN